MKLDAQVQVTVGMTVTPGPVTLALRAAQGEHYCPCHLWHRHDGEDGFTCNQEWSAA